MLFNSLEFLLFIVAVYIGYRLVNLKWQNRLLLLASYFFYSCWDVRLLFIIVVSTVLNYCCGVVLSKGILKRNERFICSIWLVLSCFIFVVLDWKIETIKISRRYFSLLTPALDLNFISIVIFLLTIFISIVLYFDFFNKYFYRSINRKTILIFGVSGNLLILAFFKYYNFFIESISLVFGSLFLFSSTYLNIVSVVGVSFFTFKGISYCVDSYKGNINTQYSYTDFACYIAFFPALLAGPIDRASCLLNQLTKKRILDFQGFVRGLHLVVYGLFKKIVISDGVIRTVSAVYDSSGDFSWIEVFVATILFTFQIYCDFSGYTDIARGVAKFFGFNLTINFRQPYFSQDPSEFWSRWHISLSTWLRDYLYIPLGGNRGGVLKSFRNLFVTMALGGLWHGAAWNYVLWGCYHGLVLIIYRLVSKNMKFDFGGTKFMLPYIKGALLFLIVCYGWLLFRATSFESIIQLTSILIYDFGNLDFDIVKPRAAAIFGLPIFFAIEIFEGVHDGDPFYSKLPVSVWTAIYSAIIYCLALGMATESAKFIYLNF